MWLRCFFFSVRAVNVSKDILIEYGTVQSVTRSERDGRVHAGGGTPPPLASTISPPSNLEHDSSISLFSSVYIPPLLTNIIIYSDSDLSSDLFTFFISRERLKLVLLLLETQG